MTWGWQDVLFYAFLGVVICGAILSWARVADWSERRAQRRANRTTLKVVRREPVRFDVPPLRMKTETNVRCLFGHDALMSESDYTPDHGWICGRHLDGERETAARESYGSKVTA